jgi:hypothetical protein
MSRRRQRFLRIDGRVRASGPDELTDCENRPGCQNGLFQMPDRVHLDSRPLCSDPILFGETARGSTIPLSVSAAPRECLAVRRYWRTLPPVMKRL